MAKNKETIPTPKPPRGGLMNKIRRKIEGSSEEAEVEEPQEITNQEEQQEQRPTITIIPTLTTGEHLIVERLDLLNKNLTELVELQREFMEALKNE